MRFKGRWQKTESDLRNSKIEPSLCRCATTSVGPRMETLKNVCFEFFRSQVRLTQKDFRMDVGHSLDPEQKKNGMERTLTSPKVYGTALQR